MNSILLQLLSSTCSSSDCSGRNSKIAMVTKGKNGDDCGHTVSVFDQWRDSLHGVVLGEMAFVHSIFSGGLLRLCQPSISLIMSMVMVITMTIIIVIITIIIIVVVGH